MLIETLILLTSSFTCGLATLAVSAKNKRATLILFGITLILGLAFLSMEIAEFSRLIAEGNSWQRSGFLSSFFTLVGTHGLHIAIGLIWTVVLMFKLARSGFIGGTSRRLLILSMFWHFLDVVWIFIFTIVYLLGEVSL